MTLMLSNQRGFIPAFILPLLPYIGLVLLSGLLYWQIGKTAKEKEAHRATIAINQSQAEAIARMQAESALTEVLLVEHAGKRETIVEQREVVKTRIREVIRDAPPNDCLLSAVDPVVLDCLLSDSCEALGDTLQTANDSDTGR